MTKEELQTRIEKVNEKIEKIEKRIKKWTDSKTEKACIKHYDYMLTWGPEYTEESILKRFYEEWLHDCDVEIRRATSDLTDAKTTLDKYTNALNLILAREDVTKIPAIVEFLNRYGEQLRDYIHHNVNVLVEYYKVNSELCDWHNHNSWKVRSGELSREEYNRVYNELSLREKELYQNVDNWTKICYNKYADNHLDENKLNDLIEKEKEACYWDLIKRITDKAGEIQDASSLRFGAKGELNGLVIGSKAKVKVETISAGGYNVQRFHYRTLVHVVK